MNPVRYDARANDEIDLVDLWLVFKRYQLQFWITFLAVTAIGVIIAFTWPTQYNYKATLAIGGLQTQAGFDQLIEPEALATALENAYIPEATRQYLANSPGQEAPRVIVEVPEKGNLVVLKTQAGAAQGGQTRGLLNAVVARVQAVHSEELNTQLNAKKKALQAQQASLTQYRQRLTAMQQAPSASPVTAAMLETQIAALSQQIAQIEADLQHLAATGLQPTRLLGDITRALQPSTLGAAVMLVLAVLLAGFLALLLVFVLAFLAQAKKREAEGARFGTDISVTAASAPPLRRVSGG